MMVMRMFNRCMPVRFVLAALLGGIALTLTPRAYAQDGERLQVVASMSILADMVREIGGDHVEVTDLVGPDSDAHAFEPRPKDARALGQAQVLVVNGIGFEFWLPRLLASSSFRGVQIVAAQGIAPRRLAPAEHDHEDDHDHEHEHEDAHGHDEQHRGHGDRQAQAEPSEHGHHHGEFDPHAWQDPGNALVYVENIARGLSRADPENQDDYARRAADYAARIKELDRELIHAFGELPKASRSVITQHDAFGYFSLAYGVDFISAVGISSAAEPSAKEVASIIAQARARNIKGIFVENISNPRLVDQIAREAGARMGGTLYSDALAKAGHPADTYLGMMRWNARQLLDVLKPAS